MEELRQVEIFELSNQCHVLLRKYVEGGESLPPDVGGTPNEIGSYRIELTYVNRNDPNLAGWGADTTVGARRLVGLLVTLLSMKGD